jgi:hypothetical protein
MQPHRMIPAKKLSLCIAVALLGITLFALHSAFRKHYVTLSVRGWGVIHSTSSSLLRYIPRDKCILKFVSNEGVINQVTFHQDFFRSPILIIPSTRTNTFFCVYDNDVNWQLIRIDLGQQFRPLPQESPLRNRVLQSTCAIDRVSKQDFGTWTFVAETLENSNASNYGEWITCPGFPLRGNRKKLVASIRNCGDAGIYPGELIDLNYHP